MKIDCEAFWLAAGAEEDSSRIKYEGRPLYLVLPDGTDVGVCKVFSKSSRWACANPLDPEAVSLDDLFVILEKKWPGVVIWQRPDGKWCIYSDLEIFDYGSQLAVCTTVREAVCRAISPEAFKDARAAIDRAKAR